MNTAILPVAGACDLAYRPAFSKFNNSVVELAADDEVNFRMIQEAIRLDLNGRTDESHFQVRFNLLHQPDKRHVIRKSDG